MIYLLDLRWVDNFYDAFVHLVTPVLVNDTQEANLFYNELIAGLKRKNVGLLNCCYYRIDDTDEHMQNGLDYINFQRQLATATMRIEPYVLEKPDQTKSLAENLIERFFVGENSTAKIAKKYEIPVRALDRETRNPVSKEMFYFSIEHLITSI